MKDMRWDGSWSRSADRIHWFPIALSHLQSIWFGFEQRAETQYFEKLNAIKVGTTEMLVWQFAKNWPDHLQIISFVCFLCMFFCWKFGHLRNGAPLLKSEVSCWISPEFRQQKSPKCQLFPSKKINLPAFWKLYTTCAGSTSPKYHGQLSIFRGSTAVKSCEKSCSQARGRWINKDGWGVTFWNPKNRGKM